MTSFRNDTSSFLALRSEMIDLHWRWYCLGALITVHWYIKVYNACDICIWALLILVIVLSMLVSSCALLIEIIEIKDGRHDDVIKCQFE